jgi:hypothetical protein
MHPYIEELEAKEFRTLDESAILYAFKRPIVQDKDMRRWLRELNPNKLSGSALGEWVQEVIDSLGRK